MYHRLTHHRGPPCALAALALSLLLAFPAHAAPVGGQLAAGNATISGNAALTTITQSTANAIINWQGFSIGAGETVQFRQPGSSSVTLNRVLGPDPSAIFGNLSANGRVFLVNPAGVLFGAGSSVNVGGLVASTLDIADGDFMGGRHGFSGGSRASVVNRGTITADGGSVALLGASVANHGVISARMGSVVLAAGEAITLDVLGDGLLHAAVDRAAVDAAVSNGGLIQADGGRVLLTTQAAGSLLSTVVNNTGVIQARTISNRNGTIKLMGTMLDGTVDVAGTLDASAPNGGDGGFIETSAARVQVRDGARVTTLAASGRSGEWLIDPLDFVIGPGGNIGAAGLTTALNAGNVTIDTSLMPGAGNGDITVDATVAVAWAGNNTLRLNAAGKVTINGTLSPTLGNLAVCCGSDIEVNGTITTVGGSVLLASGGGVRLNPTSTVTLTDGNLMVCAANDINLMGTVTLTRGTNIPGLSLGLPNGMTLKAGLGPRASGVGGGTLVFAPTAATTVNTASVLIQYSPPDFASAPTNFAPNFNPGIPITTQRLVFPDSAPKAFDGTTATTLVGLKGNPAGVTLVALPGATANFDTPSEGLGKVISFTGYTLGGPNAAAFALAETCCGPAPAVARTTGAILAAVLPVVPPVVVPIPVPVPIVPPPVVLLPDGDVGSDSVLPQFIPFAVSPLLLQPPSPLLTVAPVTSPAMELVVVQAAAPPAPTVTAPAAAAAPAAAPAPAVPYRAPVRPPRPYRN